LREIEKLLPPAFSSIHLICQLTTEQFDEAIKAEIIRPTVRRSEIEYLRKTAANNDEEPKKMAELPPVFRQMAAGGHCELVFPNDLGPNDCARIGRLLNRLRTNCRVQIVAIKNTEPHDRGR